MFLIDSNKDKKKIERKEDDRKNLDALNTNK